MNIGLDIIFFLLIVAFPIIAYFVGEERSQRMLAGALIGSFAATQLVGLLLSQVGAVIGTNISSFLGPVIISICVFLPILGKRLRDPKWPKSKLKAMFTGLLAGFVAVGFSIATLKPEQLNSLVTDYNLISIAYDLRIYVLAISVVWFLVSYLMVGKPKK